MKCSRNFKSRVLVIHRAWKRSRVSFAAYVENSAKEALVQPPSRPVAPFLFISTNVPSCSERCIGRDVTDALEANTFSTLAGYGRDRVRKSLLFFHRGFIGSQVPLADLLKLPQFKITPDFRRTVIKLAIELSSEILTFESGFSLVFHDSFLCNRS